MKKNMDRLISVFAAAAFISIISAAAYFHGQYLNNIAAGALEKTAGEARALIAGEIRRSAMDASYISSIFREPLICLDLSDMSVRPPEYRAGVLSELELKHRYFGADILEILKTAVKTSSPEAAVSMLSYYLNDHNDQYTLEKAVLYIYLIKLKNGLNMPFDGELKAFRNLAAAIESGAEIRFLYDKLKEAIVSSKKLSGDSLADLLSGGGTKNNGPDKKGGGAAAGENIQALFLSVKNEALSVNSGENINISPLLTGENKNHIIVSLSVETFKVAAAAGVPENTAARKIAAAAIINIDALNNILKNKYGAAVEESVTGKYFADFCGPYKISSAAVNFGRNYTAEAAFYLPVMIILAVFYALKRRENEAYRLSLNMTDFVSKISHQLKTPLSSSLLHLELAEKHLETGESEKARGDIALAHEEARSLAFLFENYSVLNRIFSDSVVLNMQECDIEQELLLHLRSYKTRMDAGSLKVSFGSLAEASAQVDKWAFYNIIANLISNSLKYVKKPVVEINFASKTANGRLVLSISDNGPGISEADAPKIFDKFYKGSEAGGEFRSSGLGLFIARTLAQKMDAELVVNREYNNGAMFDLHMRMK
jgi:signal transduction histidine kinase